MKTVTYTSSAVDRLEETVVVDPLYSNGEDIILQEFIMSGSNLQLTKHHST